MEAFRCRLCRLIKIPLLNKCVRRIEENSTIRDILLSTWNPKTHSHHAHPLPRPGPFDVNTRLLDSYHAYRRCLDLEDHHATVEKTGILTVLICARLLGYMLIEAPVDAGREDFATEVIRCADDEALQALANLYKNHLICCFWSNKGPIPIPTLHPPEPSFNIVEDEYVPLLQATALSDAGAKRRALIRDNYRCVLTGKIDDVCLEAGDVTLDGSEVTVTRASHIFDWPTNEDPGVDRKRHYAASLSAILNHFGEINVDELNEAGIHRLQNVLTLDSVVDGWFSRLKVWLERRPEDPINYYRPAATQPYFIERMPAGIQLTTPDPVEYPLPDPRYLAVHAACARVAHLSGAAEYMEMIFREMEEAQVLADDGGSADVLYHPM
ncbi:hypothetical protein BD779DRAFT_1613478 [Infundibulicybe gibba]|nr:hypothetical protein BD779DRAFT_1613478 [Infundibulicybe gibba]